MNIKTKEYIDSEINHLWCKVKIIRDNNTIITDEAKRLMEHRLHTMNDLNAKLDKAEKVFHDRLAQQSTTFVTKLELGLINKDIAYLQKIINIGVGIWLLLQCIIVAVLLLVFK